MQAGFKGTNNALAASWLNWKGGIGLKDGRYGAVTIIKRKNATSDKVTGSSTGNHVGFFVNQSASRLRLLGGKQSDSVKYSNFNPRAYGIRGYFWPSAK